MSGSMTMPEWRRLAGLAKADIVSALREFARSSGLALYPAVPKFCELYNQNQIPVSAETRTGWPEIKAATVLGWHRASRRDGLNGLAPRYGNRAGTGLIDTQPELRDFILAMVAHNHLLSTRQILAGARAQFAGDDVRVPSYDGVVRWLKRWKAQNPSEFLLISNPDAWKSRHLVSLGRADYDVTEPLQIVEIDGSPIDILCTDGRHYMTAAIDVATRMPAAVLTPTANAEAALLCTRKVARRLGVPANIRHDQGKEYLSRRFQTALIDLDIGSIVVPPFSGDKKPFIERFIRSVMHGFAPWCGGYIGANPGERRAIESREEFARRLGKGQGKIFAVKYTAAELQARLDRWIDDVYANDVHSGLGMSPKQAWAAWLEAGGKPRWVPERVLDVLLADCGEAAVLKDGVHFARARFWHDGMAAIIGKKIRIGRSENMGELYCFDPPNFLFVARNDERDGLALREMTLLARGAQRQWKREKHAEHVRVKRKFTPERVADAIAQQGADRGTTLAVPEEVAMVDSPMVQAAIQALNPPAVPELHEEHADHRDLDRWAADRERSRRAAGNYDEEQEAAATVARYQEILAKPRLDWTGDEKDFVDSVMPLPEIQSLRRRDRSIGRAVG